MRYFIAMLLAAIFSAMPAITPACATEYLFTLNPKPFCCGGGTTSFTVGDNPFETSSTYHQFGVHADYIEGGPGNGDDGIVFYDFGGMNLGGIYMWGPVLFTGPLDDPEFTTGSFTVYSGVFEQGPTALTISLVKPPVPEPATWAMMLLGFGGAGIALRRRKSKRGTLVEHKAQPIA